MTRFEATKAALKRAEDAGVRLKDIEYVGGHPLPSGSLHFYVVTQSMPSSRDSQNRFRSYRFCFVSLCFGIGLARG